MARAGWTLSRIAAVAALAVLMLVINVLPAITGVLARSLGFSPNVLGGLGSATLLGSAVGSFSAMALTKRITPRTMALGGVVIFMAGNLALCVFPVSFQMISFSALAGFGTGLAMSACYYVFGLDHEETNSAAGMLAQTALASLVITAIPIITRLYDWRAMYACIAALALPCLLLAPFFPTSYLRESASIGPDTTAESGERGFWILLSVALSAISIFMVWTYLDRMGAEAGVAQTSINQALSLSTVFGFVSSGLVIWAGRRVTVPLALATCVGLNTAGILASGASTSSLYVAGVVLFYFTLPVYLSAQFGIAMRSVASKRFAVNYSLALQAAGIGPILGGYIAQLYGFGTLRVLSIAMMLMSFLILWASIVRLQRRAPSLTIASPAAAGRSLPTDNWS